MKNGFARRKEQSKAEILNAARELFSQFGAEKVSMADLARKAGVSQATIYNHFGSKDRLVQEFVSSMVDQLITQVQAILAPKNNYRDKMNAFMDFIGEKMARARLVGHEAPVFSGSADLMNDPEIKKIREDAQEKIISILMSLVQEGQAEGQINPDLSEQAVRFYLKAFMNIFIDPQVRFQFYNEPQLIRDLGQLLMGGLNAAPCDPP